MSAMWSRAHYLPLILITGYSILLGALTVPTIQRELLFLHHIRLPFLGHYDNPERYGLAPFKTRNFQLTTSDGETIGLWHILPHSVYRTATNTFPPSSAIPSDVFEAALSVRPTIIYFHGNAVTRAAPHRVKTYGAFTTRLDCNVLAIDYRGFGDSTGTPSEEGLLLDARAAWDYVTETIKRVRSSSTDIKSIHEHTKPEEMIILAGQSLGTGVVSSLAGELAKEETVPRALVLVAPFTSIADLLTDYWLLSVIPILSPLKFIPGAQGLLKSFLIYSFDSVSALKEATSPILILHSKDDRTIPHSHSARLFNHFRSEHAQIVTENRYPGWGVVRSYNRSDKGEVVWWEGDHGGHSHLGWAEGTMDLIARIAKLDIDS